MFLINMINMNEKRCCLLIKDHYSRFCILFHMSEEYYWQNRGYSCRYMYLTQKSWHGPNVNSASATCNLYSPWIYIIKDDIYDCTANTIPSRLSLLTLPLLTLWTLIVGSHRNKKTIYNKVERKGLS